ncbi:MAG: hypothetical protein NC541_07285 [bacterium]|nr:hypothetical protein [bacterium]
MIDWEEIAGTENEDELKAVKLWLFQENMRLENEKKELAASQEKFLNERLRLRRELEELNRRTVQERKRLREENLFFEKKMAILQDGFRQLDLDRQELEKQKESLNKAKRTPSLQDGGDFSENTVHRLFAGINNSLALRKRYRDLIKIFHPDNLFGDEELVQMINREYVRRKEEL